MAAKLRTAVSGLTGGKDDLTCQSTIERPIV
jgi:hypothetical protein